MANADEMTAWDFNSSELPYYDQLYKTALRMTRSVAETEDLLQETYLKAFRYYSGFEEGTNLKAWLFRIMKNNFINRYRKAQKRPSEVEFSKVEESEGEVVLTPFPRGQPSEHGFRMTSVGEEDVLFEAPEHDFPKRISYRRDDERLIARIDDGTDEMVDKWEMKPAPCD